MAIATRLRNPTEASAFLSGAGGLDVTVEAIEQPPAIVRVHDGLSQSVSAVIDEAFLEYTPPIAEQQQSGDSNAAGASSQTGDGDENDSSSETTIIIIAAAVGASVGGVILLVGLLIYFYVCRSKKKAGSPSSAPPVVNIEMASATSTKSEALGAPAQAV